MNGQPATKPASERRPAYIDTFVTAAIRDEINEFLSLSPEQSRAHLQLWDHYATRITELDAEAAKRIGDVSSELAKQMALDEHEIDGATYAALAEEYHRERAITLRQADQALLAYAADLAELLSDEQQARAADIMPLIRRHTILSRRETRYARFANVDFSEVIKAALEPSGELFAIANLRIDEDDTRTVQNELDEIAGEYLASIDSTLKSIIEDRRGPPPDAAGLIVGEDADPVQIKILKNRGKTWSRIYLPAEAASSRIDALIAAMDSRVDAPAIRARWRERFMRTYYPSLFREQPADRAIAKVRSDRSITPEQKQAVDAIWANFERERAVAREKVFSAGIRIMKVYGSVNLIPDEREAEFNEQLTALRELSSNTIKQICRLLGWPLTQFD